MSEDIVAGTVEGALAAARSANVLDFRLKAKPPRKARTKAPRPANDHDDGVPLDLGGHDAEEMNAEWAYVVRGGTGCILREMANAPVDSA